MKSHILEKIAEAVFALKAYPHAEEIETVASALVLKHPCLTEPGKGKGFGGWKKSINTMLCRACRGNTNIGRGTKEED